VVDLMHQIKALHVRVRRQRGAMALALFNQDVNSAEGFHGPGDSLGYLCVVRYRRPTECATAAASIWPQPINCARQLRMRLPWFWRDRDVRAIGRRRSAIARPIHGSRP